MTYLINYDLHTPEQNYDRLIRAIQSYGAWAKINKSCWAICSQQSSVQIQKHLSRQIDANDRLFICPFSSWAAYNLDAEVVNWLNSN